MIRDQRGFIALIAVLIVGAASLSAAIATLTIGTDLQKTTLVYQQSVIARNLATACTEESLQKVRETPTYVGSATLEFTAGSCTYTVTNTSGTITITSLGMVENIMRKIRTHATIGSQSISVTQWQEIE